MKLKIAVLFMLLVLFYAVVFGSSGVLDEDMVLAILVYIVKYIVLLGSFAIISLKYGVVKDRFVELILRYMLVLIFLETLHFICYKVMLVAYEPKLEIVIVMLINPFILILLLILGLIHAIMLVLFCKRFVYEYGCFGLITQWFLSFVLIDAFKVRENCYFAKIILFINRVGKFLILLEVFIIELSVVKLAMVILLENLE